MRPLTIEDVPLVPLFWHVLVEPLAPKNKTASGLYISDDAQRVEKIQNTVGRVLAVGQLAFQGRAASGLCLGDDNKARDLKSGDYVLFARYTGQTVTFKVDGDDRAVILISDTELLAVVTNPEKIRFWI